MLKWIKRKLCCAIILLFCGVLIASNVYTFYHAYALGKDYICGDVHFYANKKLIKIRGCEEHRTN